LLGALRDYSKESFPTIIQHVPHELSGVLVNDYSGSSFGRTILRDCWEVFLPRTPPKDYSKCTF